MQCAIKYNADPINNVINLSNKSITIYEFKLLDKRIKINQAQYDLDREAAKNSSLSSNEMDKYEYLTGEDLGYKPSVVEKATLEYSPLVMILTNNTKSKTNKNKVDNKNKKNQDLLYYTS